MMDATDIKAHPTASSLNKGGMTSTLHGVCHSKVVPDGSTHVRDNATSLVLMGCSRTRRLQPR